jgi:hypothetical protein
MRGKTFEVVTLTSCIFRSAMLPLKKIYGRPLAELSPALPSLFPGCFRCLEIFVQGALLLFEKCGSHWQEN